MENVVFLEIVAALVLDNLVLRGVLVVGVDFLAALVRHQEYWFDARCGLRADAHGAGRGYGQQRDVAASVGQHIGVHLRVGLGQALDEGVQLLAVGVIDGEAAALFGHRHRRAVGRAGKGALHADGKVGGLVGAVAQAHCGQHIALGGDAEAGAAAFEAFHFDVEPQILLHRFDFVAFGVGLDLGDDFLHFLQLQVDQVVHQALAHSHVLPEQVEIELGVRRERILDVAEKVDCQQAAAVVGAQRNLAAGVGADRAVAAVGIAVGHRLAYDGVPKQHARLSTRPGIGYNLVPQRGGIDFLAHHRVVRIDWILLHKGLAFHSAAHKFVGNLDRNVGTGNLSLLQLGIDKLLRIRVLDRDREHQGSASAALRHLAGGVGIALHKGHYAGRGQGAVLDGAAAGAYVAQVVAHAAAALHQLHLLLVYLHNATIGVAVAAVADHEAVRQRNHLKIIAYARHRAALRNDVAEIFQQSVDVLLAYRVGIFALDARKLRRQAMVHHIGVKLEYLVSITQCVLVHPHVGCQLVAVEIFHRRFHNLFRRVLRILFFICLVHRSDAWCCFFR